MAIAIVFGESNSKMQGFSRGTLFACHPLAVRRWYIASVAAKEQSMATADDRLAELKTRMSEQTIGMRDLSSQILALGEQLSAQIRGVDERLSQQMWAFDDKLSRRMDRLDGKIDDVRKELSGRIDVLDQKLDRRVDTLDAKIDRVMAFQVAMLLALVGGMITVAFKSYLTGSA
ncbi:MAG: hypothetical protein EXQ55_02815 [Acidobacteria bacterium]|nr:hypothetical protein [Acidobacteriota bacterium]